MDYAQAGHSVLCEMRDFLAQLFWANKVSQRNSVIAATATDNYAGDVSLPITARTVMITLFDNGLIWKRNAKTGEPYDPEMELLAPGIYTFQIETKTVQVKNATAGSNARYSIVALS